MRALIIALLQVLAWLGILAFVVIGALAGRHYASMAGLEGMLGNPLAGLAIGAILGLALAVALFGPTLLLLDIREQTRRTADALGRGPRRGQAETAPASRQRREPEVTVEPVLPSRVPDPPRPRAELRP